MAEPIYFLAMGAFNFLLVLATSSDLAQISTANEQMKVIAAPLAAGAPQKNDVQETNGAAKKNAALNSGPNRAAPGKGTELKPLTAEQQARFEAGKAFYPLTCGACHQLSGLGQEGLAPPLVDSEWVIGSEQKLVRIVLHGLRGAIAVKGKVYELDMPPLAVLEDEQIASLLTYVRREWGHIASPVETTNVAKIRADTEKREEAWTAGELSKIP
jgi:mono/diheme cytochrome c family protein